MISYIKRGLFFVLFITSGLIAYQATRFDIDFIKHNVVFHHDGNALPVIDQIHQGYDWIKKNANLKATTYPDYIIKVYNSDVLSPAKSHIHRTYDWLSKTDLKTAYITGIRPLIYDGSSIRIIRFLDWFYHEYIQTWFKMIQQKATNLVCYWKQQLDEYVNGPEYVASNEDALLESTTGVVESNIRRTAKRILDYVDEVNRESVRSGMKKEDAKRKAHDIILEVTNNNKKVNDYQEEEEKNEAFKMEEQDMTKVAFEIREIFRVSENQRLALEQHLTLIRSYLTPSFLNQEDPDLLASALKSEIDQMRQEAEDQVRARTNQALHHLNPLFTDLVMSRVKNDIHSAQRVALRDLRQVYRTIYQVNEDIDNLFNQPSSI